MHDTALDPAPQPIIREQTANAESAITGLAQSGVTLMLDEITCGCGHGEDINIGARVWDRGTETEKRIARGRESETVLYDTVQYNRRRNGVFSL